MALFVMLFRYLAILATSPIEGSVTCGLIVGGIAGTYRNKNGDDSVTIRLTRSECDRYILVLVSP